MALPSTEVALPFMKTTPLALGLAIEFLGRARRAQFLVDDIGHRVGVGLDHLQGLLDRGGAADRRAIGQMVGVAAAGALHEGDVLDRRAIGRLDRRALGQHGLEFDAGDDVGRGAIAEMGQLGRVIGTPAGGDDDGADLFGDFLAAVRNDHLEGAGLAGGLGDGGVGQDADAAIRLNLGDQLRRCHCRKCRDRAAHAGRASSICSTSRRARRSFPRQGRHSRDSAASSAAFRPVTPPPTTRMVREHLAERGGGGLQGLGELRRRHADEVGGQHFGVFFMRRLRPCDLFAQVGAHHRHAVEAEFFRHDAWRAGADHHAVDRAVGDVLVHGRHAFGGAERVAHDAMPDAEFVLADLFERAYVDGVGDAAALAKIDARFFLGHASISHVTRRSFRRFHSRPKFPASRFSKRRPSFLGQRGASAFLRGAPQAFLTA